MGVLSPRPCLVRHWGLTSHAKHGLYPPSSGLSSASWSFRCVVRRIHSPRAQRTSPVSSIPVCGTPCVCGVSACVFMQCLCRSPASEGAFAAPGAPSSSFVPQEASSLGQTGPGLCTRSGQDNEIPPVMPALLKLRAFLPLFRRIAWPENRENVSAVILLLVLHPQAFSFATEICFRAASSSSAVLLFAASTA